MLMAKKCFLYKGAKLWNSVSNGIKTTENISKFQTLLKNGIELLAYVCSDIDSDLPLHLIKCHFYLI